MQTSHVSNAANVLTANPATNKQPDANPAAEQFGKVLSREVSQRNGKSEAHSNKEAGSQPPAQQAAKAPAKPAESKAPSKPAEAKAAKESKQADKAQADEEVAETAAALSDDFLAMVANVIGLNTPAAETAETATPETAVLPTDVPQDAAAAAAATAAMLPADAADAPAPLPTAAAAIGTQTEATSLATAGAGLKQDNPALQAKHADRAAAKPELPAAAAAQASMKAENINLQAANQPAAAKAQDFAAAMNESVNGVANGMQPVQQQAGLHAVHQHGAQSAERLTPRVGTPAWDQALGQKVVWMVGGEMQSASLTLNPPDLGPLQVVLNVSNSQANATFIAAQPEVRQALEAALPKLRDMLGEAGIQLGQASINSGTPNQQGGFEAQDSHAGRGHGASGNRESAGADSQVRTSRVQPSSAGLGLVDTFV